MKPYKAFKIGAMTLFINGLILIGAHSEAKAQASDEPGLPYHVPHIMEIITNAVEHPTDTNAFVGMLFDAPDFPQVTIGEQLSEETLEDIKKWVETHVEIMQTFQQARKKNYDKFYLNQ